MDIDVNVIGDGSFGGFLKRQFKGRLNEHSDNVILAIPFDAYDEVANLHKGKHLINVCSVQTKANRILETHSNRVTGIHPLFGAQSFGIVNHTCVVTKHTGIHSELISELFEMIGCVIVSQHEEEHDILMAKVHLPMIELSETMGKLIDVVKDVDENLFPPSFKAMIKFHKEISFTEGTKSSIKSNMGV
jgi:prephenate dehydrogenase